MRWHIGLILLVLAAALAPVPPEVTERLYSNGIYAALQPGITGASNLVPVALLDLLTLVVAAAWIGLAVRDARQARDTGWLHGVGRVALRTAVWSAGVYLAFLAVWGLNYRRVRLVDKLAFDAAGVSPEHALATAMRSADRANSLYAGAHAAGWIEPDAIDPVLAGALRDAVRTVGGGGFAVARPKRTWGDWYFRRAAVSGMTDPFFLETLIASDVLPFERPFVTAHEWSHLAGIADEGDANFVAWLACNHAAPRDQYSGWLFLYQELLQSLGRRERLDVAATLEAGPRDDLRAIRDRYVRNVSPGISAAGWRVYDSYLKANRVEAGAASYAEVVRLVLGVRFDADERPVLRLKAGIRD